MRPALVKNAVLVGSVVVVLGSSGCTSKSSVAVPVSPETTPTASRQLDNLNASPRPSKAPKPPSAVTVDYIGSQVVRLTWKNSPGATGYQIYSGGKKISKTGPKKSFVAVTATYGSHCYTIVALGKRGSGDSKRSSQVCLDIASPQPTPIPPTPIRPPSIHIPPPPTCPSTGCLHVRGTTPRSHVSG